MPSESITAAMNSKVTAFAIIISQFGPFGAVRRIHNASVAMLPRLCVCLIFEVSVNIKKGYNVVF